MTFRIFLHPRQNDDGTHTIYIRCIQDRKKKEVSTGIRIEDKYFDPDPKDRAGVRRWVKVKHHFSDTFNNQLMYKIQLGQKAVEEAQKQGRRLSLPEIGNILKSDSLKISAEFEFLSWARDQISIEYPEKKNFDLYSKYMSSWQHIKDFNLSKALYPWQVDLSFVKRYQNYLEEDKQLATGTIAKHLQRFRMMIRWAVQHNKIESENDPFLYYRHSLTKESKQHRYLSVEDLRVYEGLKLTGMEELARDVNLFQLYAAGARIGDVLMCRIEDIKQTIDADGNLRYYWQYTTRKSRHNKQLVTLLPDQSIPIYIRYKNERPTGRLFPLIHDDIANDHSNHVRKIVNSKTNVLNKALHRIGSKIDLTYKLTTHVARYSFAEFGRSFGDITALQDSLGHSSVKTTEIYARNQNQERKDELIKKVFGR